MQSIHVFFVLLVDINRLLNQELDDCDKVAVVVWCRYSQWIVILCQREENVVASFGPCIDIDSVTDQQFNHRLLQFSTAVELGEINQNIHSVLFYCV